MSLIQLIMIAGGLLLGFATGHLMHRSDYCMAGMFRDLFLFRRTLMVKSFVLFLALAMPLFELVRLSGLVEFPFPKYGPPSLVNLFGGFMFGVAMVLAGGCIFGTLYKLGAGSFASLLAFAGLIIGSGLYAELHSGWSALSALLQLPTAAITLPDLLAIPPWGVLMLVLPVLCLLLVRWFRQGSLQNPVVVEGYLQPWKAAVGMALISVLFVLLFGLPMGITTSCAKLAAMGVLQLAPEHYGALPFFQGASVRYMPPLGGDPVVGGAGAWLDGVALIQFPLIIGILAGSAWSAIRLGEWRMRFSLPWRQVCSALLGGIGMGLASRIAPSCNVWHLFGGLPILGLQSILFLLGMLPGAWLGGQLMIRLVLRT